MPNTIVSLSTSSGRFVLSFEPISSLPFFVNVVLLKFRWCVQINLVLDHSHVRAFLYVTHAFKSTTSDDTKKITNPRAHAFHWRRARFGTMYCYVRYCNPHQQQQHDDDAFRWRYTLMMVCIVLYIYIFRHIVCMEYVRCMFRCTDGARRCWQWWWKFVIHEPPQSWLGQRLERFVWAPEFVVSVFFSRVFPPHTVVVLCRFIYFRCFSLVGCVQARSFIVTIHGLCSTMRAKNIIT